MRIFDAKRVFTGAARAGLLDLANLQAANWFEVPDKRANSA
jgi:hypothetical protein